MIRFTYKGQPYEFPIDKKLLLRFWSKVYFSGECWEWTGVKNQYGYGSLGFFLGKDSDGKNWSYPQYSHRITWQISYGAIPEGLEVCHSCDNPSCVKPEHLFLGTHQDNMNDCMNKGRMPPPPNRKLTLKEAGIIRSMHRKFHRKYGASALGRKFGISRWSVYEIIDGNSYKGINEEAPA